MKIEALINEAYKVAVEYKPSEDYSSGSVGAALITKRGNIYTGVCIDCACGIGFCAEHSAIAEMLKHRESEIEMIVAVDCKKIVLPPYGRCREMMFQVNKSNMDTNVIITGGKVVTLRDLYPHPWKEAWEYSMLRIRQCQPTDKDSIWELHYAALEPTGAMLPGGPWNDEDLDDIQNEYLNSGGEFLVGVLDDKIVCMGALRKKSDSMAEIKRMRVHPDYQRQGYGQIILDRLEAKARQVGYTELCLDTTTKQIPAQQFYQKNGYHEVRRTVYAGLEIILFEKSLKQS